MKIIKMMGYGLMLVIAIINYGLLASSQAAPPAINQRQNLPPFIISDDDFSPAPWTVTEEVIGSGSATVSQRLTGGNPGAFRFMSHRLPPVSGSGGNTIFVTHVYQGAYYYPRYDGEIRAIDYVEDGVILSFPFAEAFSTTQPVLVQDGRLYRSSRFIRFVAQNSSHAWETQALRQLTAADFIRVGGSENDHPDFSVNGGPIYFGFTRNNSRTSTLPPVPGNQDMVIDQGVDNWQVIVYRDNTNRPPQAADDVYILDGSDGPPIVGFLEVLNNDSDPNFDRLDLIEVTEPTYGSASIWTSFNRIIYEAGAGSWFDTFNYTISDGALTDSARVEVYIDCAICTLACLSITAGSDNINLPLIYRARDQVLKPTLDGRRYIDMYYTTNPEILVTIMANEPLRTEAVATVELWQDNLRSLTDGDGSAVITQAQVDAIKSFLNNLSAVSSPELQQLIAAELGRLGPLDDYVGLTVKAAKSRAIGDPTFYLPLIIKG
jgi:hypothetical protein